MKNKRIKQMCIICASVIVLSATGCSTHLTEKSEVSMSADSTDNSISQDALEKNIAEQRTAEDSSDSAVYGSESSTANSTAEDKEETIEPAATKEVPIYTINETTQEVESVVALIEQNTEVTPELIVELVKDSMADRLIDIGIDEVTTEGDSVIVSFQSDQAPLTLGSGSEKTILDAIAQSLVDNLPDYPKVIFRVEGNAYESGHFKYGLNEVYLDGTKTK